MSDASSQTASAGENPRLHRRAYHGMKKPHNWLQLIKFGAVGASGYIVNLVVFWLVTEQLEFNHNAAAIVAFCFAVANNFWWNRHWTFDAKDGHAGFQATRFFVVSLIALGFNLVLLNVFIELGIGELPAQAIAIVCVTPINFVGNKLWSFRD